MDIFDSKGRKIQLSHNAFLAEGGEGKLYADKGSVFKIYIDNNKISPVKPTSSALWARSSIPNRTVLASR